MKQALGQNRESVVPTNGGGQSVQSTWGSADSVAVFCLCVGSLILSVATMLRRPDLVLGADFLFHDAGHNLLVADRLLSGQMLYRDVFYPYGPISAYAYTLAAAIFGNALFTYLALLGGISGVNTGLAYVLIRRATDTRAALFVSFALLALMPIPGAIAGAFTVSPYVVIERTLLLVVALCWRPPDGRLASRIVLGSVLGLWQGVKFGGAVFAGIAVVALDLTYVLAVGLSVQRIMATLRAALVVATAFIAVELVWVVAAMRTGSSELALDIVWPAYMLRHYASIVAPEIRWPTLGGWRLAVGQYLIPLSAGMIGAWGLINWLRNACGSPAHNMHARRVSGRIFVPLLFFLTASLGYFKHVFHFQLFLWALVPSAAWQFRQCRRGSQVAILLAWAPGLLMVLRSAFVTAPAADLVRVSLPSGGSVMVNGAMSDRLSSLQRFLDQEGREAPMIYAPMGSGWHFAYRVPAATRHTWFVAPHIIRPYEWHQFEQSLDRTRALIVCGAPGEVPQAVPDVFPLPPAIAAAVYDRLELSTTTKSGCRIFRIRQQARAVDVE